MRYFLTSNKLKPLRGNQVRRLILPSTFLVLVAGCASVDSGTESARSAASEQFNDLPTSWQAVQAKVGDVENGWVASFGDPNLTELVNEAQTNNRDLRAAALNVERSWLLAKQSGAALSPQVNASLGGSGGGDFSGASSDNPRTIGIQASWELDVWGRIRSGEQAALRSAEAAEADYRFSQFSISAAVARAYFGAVNAYQQAEIAGEIVRALEKTQSIVHAQYDNGVASAQDLALAKANLASSSDTLVSAKASSEDALRALEVLLGRYPAADLFVGNTLPSKPANPPAGLPAGVLERRPDLVAAERRIAASIKSVDQAKAARLPTISLTTGASGASQDLSDLLKPGNMLWTAAANLLVPIVDGGARRTQVEVSTLEQKAAVEAYASAALNAFSEVEKALADGVTVELRKSFLEEASSASDEALRLARLQYEVGEIDLLSVLQLEQAAFGARSNLLTINRLELEQHIDLSVALGGEW
jgi:NodT family efflux transporter outer membrane factor (OMF) lipoprotein